MLHSLLLVMNRLIQTESAVSFSLVDSLLPKDLSFQKLVIAMLNAL